MTAPKVYIMYSHDSDDYKDWVKSLSDRLRTEGVDVTLDQYPTDLAPGDRLAHFMESGIADADHVLMLVSKGFASRADERKGGVGFETDQATSEIMVSGNKRKFIPVFVKLPFDQAPRFLKGVTGIQITNLFSYEREYERLYAILTNQVSEKPKLGPIRTILRQVSHGDPFDVESIRKSIGKNIEPYYHWDLQLDIYSLADYSIPEFYDLLIQNIRFEDISGYRRAIPNVFSPALKRQHTPEIVFETGDLDPTTVNLAEFEKIVISQNRLRYSFLQLYDNGPRGAFMNADQPLQTLTRLIVVLDRVHRGIGRNPEIFSMGIIKSNAKIILRGTQYPFSLTNNMIGYYFEHGPGEHSFDMKMQNLSVETTVRFLNRALEAFVCDQKSAGSPFLRVDHKTFEEYFNKVRNENPSAVQ